MSQPRLHLTDEEMLEMAKPLVQPAAIVRWFREQGYICRIKPNRMPLISRAHFEQVSGCSTAANDPSAAPQSTSSNDEPDAAALLARFTKKPKEHGTDQEKQSVRA